MRLAFRVPMKETRVTFCADWARLTASLKKKQAYIVLDDGVPFPRELSLPNAFRLTGGESCKRWAELERLLGWLAEKNAERGQPLLVLGGGATLDLGGLAAALYRRGMPLVLVPTTLLGMVDATLGGKTAVDFSGPQGLLKNFAGAFYPANEVWILPDFLRTLPLRERVSGAGEMYKTLWIHGASWNEAVLLHYVRTGDVSPALHKLVKQCLAAKRKVVASDPLDQKRLREVLNFGHTVGHALESVSGLSHGECVLWGMAVETGLLGRGARGMSELCWRALQQLGLSLPTAFEEVAPERWLPLLAGDKKTRQGMLELSLLERPGRVVRKRLTPAQVVSAIKEFPQSYQRAIAHLPE